MQRRSFIKGFLLVAGGTWLANCTKPLAKSIAGNTVKGKVTGNGLPLANVVVSDGYSVVMTDKNGNYSIDINTLAKFIFVSTPAGYKFTHEKYIARHYYSIAAAKDKSKVNFDLQKLDRDDTKHNLSFGQIHR